MHKYLFSVAPMLDVTDSPFRYLLRKLSSHALLYTEMLPVAALQHAHASRIAQYLFYDPLEQPLALQVAGSKPQDLGKLCSELDSLGFAEINLNFGCPSKAAVAGGFGLIQLKDLELCLRMIEAGLKGLKHTSFSVKTRIGVDDQSGVDFLLNLVEQFVNIGLQKLILHARCGLTKGLSPKKNLTKPPLDYEVVLETKRQFPNLEIIINGGLNDLDTCQRLLTGVDGLMIGRNVMVNPFFLHELEQFFYPQTAPPKPSFAELEEDFRTYVARHSKKLLPRHPEKALMIFTKGLPYAKHIRAAMAEQSSLHTEVDAIVVEVE